MDGDEWENERYTIEDTELLAELGLLERPVVPLEPKKKPGRPKGSKDKKPRKQRTKKAENVSDPPSSDQPTSG